MGDAAGDFFKRMQPFAADCVVLGMFQLADRFAKSVVGLLQGLFGALSLLDFFHQLPVDRAQSVGLHRDLSLKLFGETAQCSSAVSGPSA